MQLIIICLGFLFKVMYVLSDDSFFNTIDDHELDMPMVDKHSSECALILNGNKLYSNEYKHFPSSYDKDPEHSHSEEEICVTYGDVNRALYEAKRKLGNFVPSEIHELSSNLPKAVHIAVPAEIVQEATRLLARWFHLPKELILFALPKINTLKTNVKQICPSFLLPVKCEISKYRTLTGMCNNLQYPSWGSARSALIRFLPPNYGDGISELRLSRDGSPLPSARLVSFVVHHDLGEQSIRTTILVVAWSQIIGHDFSLADPATDEFGDQLECCKRSSLDPHPSCLPIDIPKNDPFYKFFNQKCMNFVRILPALKPNCPLGPRSQVNIVSGYIDGNFVYGSDQETAKRLRMLKGGRLKTTPLYAELGLKDLLPMKTGNPDRGCQRTGRPRDLFCFEAGDRRANEQVPLTVLHTLFMREHNRIADYLAYQSPDMSDEALYQETRRIVIAQIQHITFNEFLPVILGDKLMRQYGLNLVKNGYYKGYQEKVNAGVRLAFQAAAFRFGHSLIPDVVERYNKFHDKLESIRISRLIQQPFDMYKPGIMDSFILGLVNQESSRMDPQITTEVTNHLFEKPGIHFGSDLAAIDIQRGREMGIPGYNYYREYCGLKKAYDFDDLMGYFDNQTIHRFMTLYKHVDDIDLWTAGIAEYPAEGSMLGPVFNCLLAKQFVIARNADRFWYESDDPVSKFSLEQLGELRKATLAKLICDNSDDIDTVQLYPFLQPDPMVNPRVDCHKLNGIDLSVFSDHENGFLTK